MAKRFKLQTGHIVTIDDVDISLLKLYVWRVHTQSSNGQMHVVTGKGTPSSMRLSHRIAGESGKPFVVHLNGDQLDFRRSNLKAMTRAEWGQFANARMANA